MIVGFEGMFMAEIERHDESNQTLPTSEVPPPAPERGGIPGILKKIKDAFKPKGQEEAFASDTVSKEEEKTREALKEAYRYYNITDQASREIAHAVLSKNYPTMDPEKALEALGRMLLQEKENIAQGNVLQEDLQRLNNN